MKTLLITATTVGAAIAGLLLYFRKSKKKSGSIRSEDLSDHSDEDHDAPDLPSMIRSKSDSQYPTGMNKNLTAIIFDDEEEGMCSFSKVTQC